MSDENSQNRVGLLTGLDEILDPAHTAIVVVDMQNDFCAENGYIHTTQGADMSGNKPLAKRIGKLVDGVAPLAAKSSGSRRSMITSCCPHRCCPRCWTKVKVRFAARPTAGAPISTRSARKKANKWWRSAAIPHSIIHRWTTSCADGHQVAGNDRRRHQCLRRIHPARGILPRILYRDAARLRWLRQRSSARSNHQIGRIHLRSRAGKRAGDGCLVGQGERAKPQNRPGRNSPAFFSLVKRRWAGVLPVHPAAARMAPRS